MEEVERTTGLVDDGYGAIKGVVVRVDEDNQDGRLSEEEVEEALHLLVQHACILIGIQSIKVESAKEHFDWHILHDFGRNELTLLGH